MKTLVVIFVVVTQCKFVLCMCVILSSTAKATLFFFLIRKFFFVAKLLRKLPTGTNNAFACFSLWLEIVQNFADIFSNLSNDCPMLEIMTISMLKHRRSVRN